MRSEPLAFATCPVNAFQIRRYVTMLNKQTAKREFLFSKFPLYFARSIMREVSIKKVLGGRSSSSPPLVTRATLQGFSYRLRSVQFVGLTFENTNTSPFFGSQTLLPPPPPQEPVVKDPIVIRYTGSFGDLSLSIDSMFMKGA